MTQDKNVTMIQIHQVYSRFGAHLCVYFCANFMSLLHIPFLYTPYRDPSVHFTSFSSFYPTLSDFDFPRYRMGA